MRYPVGSLIAGRTTVASIPKHQNPEQMVAVAGRVSRIWSGDRLLPTTPRVDGGLRPVVTGDVPATFGGGDSNGTRER